MSPSECEGYQGLANCYMKFNKFEKAFEFYEKAISLKPDYAAAYLGKGNALYKLKEYDNALKAYDYASRLN